MRAHRLDRLEARPRPERIEELRVIEAAHQHAYSGRRRKRAEEFTQGPQLTHELCFVPGAYSPLARSVEVVHAAPQTRGGQHSEGRVLAEDAPRDHHVAVEVLAQP